MKKVNIAASSRRTPFSIAQREAIYSVILALLYFAWWFCFAYQEGSGPVEEYSYIAGFPAWFFMSCIAGFAVFSILAFLMVKLLFREVPLDENKKSGGHPRG
jgi:uncharacterized membrane protein YhdT